MAHTITCFGNCVSNFLVSPAYLFLVNRACEALVPPPTLTVRRTGYDVPSIWMKYLTVLRLSSVTSALTTILWCRLCRNGHSRIPFRRRS
eukprot:scaffold266121_cov49-Attheya_sp.AAC.1